MLKSVFLGLMFILSSTLLQAAPMQSLELLQQKVEHYALSELSTQNHDEIEVSAEKLDPRLNLKACKESELEVFNPYKTPILHTTTVGIRCRERDTHWTLYIPLKIVLKKWVLVTNRPLPKGTQLADNDFDKLKVDVSQLKHGYFSDAREIRDQVCKQNLAEGVILTPYNLQTPLLVHRGEQVSIQAVNETINVSMNGIALNDGALGDTIKVQNLSSKRIIEARISANKQVRVTI
ncbi:flagellar basal body P-ring biosynthesis protein FlgA [Legionella nautarum]|uniref:Flagella basal body P-ring formation protein FlgA n=1 Tax=Legionella nautarum TaxID=45070 RepID=A0A0W0WUU3_9GAMM|nr:flagellar basal body P-ring formation chaperone FlgA [Legionella nautarum]KTD36090.1 flagellar basal body P-ring biosynthesis protein FlgA [Legionella nautarum]